MGVYGAMRAAGYVVASVAQAVADSSRPRDQHRDYDRALRRAEDALVNAEAERDVLEPAKLCGCSANFESPWCSPDDSEDEAWDANEDFDARRSERTNTWMRDAECEFHGEWCAGETAWCAKFRNPAKDSPVEGSGDATGGVPSPPSVVPLSELVDRVADELRAQHQPNWLCDKVRATAAMLKTQGL